MYQTKNVLLLALGFMIIGLSAVFFSHKAKEAPVLFVKQENYVEYIRPWIEKVYLDPSLDNIAKVKEDLFNFKGADRSIGPAHIALFMAFDTWEKYLLTGNNVNKDQSVKHFSSVEILLPDIDLEIQSLKKILNQQNV